MKIVNLPAPKGWKGNSLIDRKIIKRIGTNIGSSDFNKEGPASASIFTGDSSVAVFGSILILDATFIEKNHPDIMATKLTGRPKRITIPRSASRIPAAATGPGVGGISECVTYNPRLNAIAVTARVTFICLAKALANGDKTIKAESQKTGMLTIYPTMLMASGIFFFPTIFNAPTASLKAPPDISRNFPIMDPANITMPI